METKELYVDGLGNIFVTGTMVRLDLVSLAEPAGEGKEAVFQTKQRLVMPVDSFLQAFGMMEGIVNKMIDSGAVSKKTKQ